MNPLGPPPPLRILLLGTRESHATQIWAYFMCNIIDRVEGSRVPSAISIATCPVIPPVMADGDGADSQLWNVSEWDHFDRGDL